MKGGIEAEVLGGTFVPMPRAEYPAHLGRSLRSPGTSRELMPEILLSYTRNGRILGWEYLYPAPLAGACVLDSSTVPTPLALPPLSSIVA